MEAIEIKRDRDQETIQITSNGWRPGITLDKFSAGGWRSQVVGNEGPICHFDFAAEVPESCQVLREPVGFEELSRLQ